MNNTGNAISTFLTLTAFVAGGGLFAAEQFGLATLVFFFFLFLAASPRQISEWQRGIKLRFGKFHGVLEPGISWVIPGVDSVSDVVDMRIRSTSFSAEKTLTSDTVPVNVDAVLFWVVTDAQGLETTVVIFETEKNVALDGKLFYIDRTRILR